MQYRSGQQIRIPFTVPALNGSNTTGLAWTISAFIKDGVVVSSGAEYASISVDTSDDAFYELLFTPTNTSTSIYLVKVISDATIADVFEEVLEPNWSWLNLFAKMIHNRGVSPETVEFKLPDGTTTLVKFKMTKDGLLVTREEV